MTNASTKPTRAAPASGGNPAVLNGVYRIKWSAKELLHAGANWRYVHTNCGQRCVVTMRLQDGRFSFCQAPPPSCAGTYTVSGMTVHLQLFFTARWLLRNGELSFTDVISADDGDKVFFGAKPWKKIG